MRKDRAPSVRPRQARRIAPASRRRSPTARPVRPSARHPGFCERQAFDAVHLWTFQGPHAARHLYESHGFRLVEERPGRQWEAEVLEQRFARPITRAD
ncbi:hypothetical protein CCS92_31735 [Methylobacterium radiotolerans]|nr:hypothetical protein CCS92_31735 [Methylobacterium radiotolerans]